MQKRFWEIDALRGIAIVMMVVFHVFADLHFFSRYEFGIGSGLWLVFARTTATIFIFLVGVSLTLSYSRAKKPTFKKYLLRGLKIFGWGLAITIVTLVFLKGGYIFFGVLHLIGISIILAYAFIRLRYLNLGLGILLIMIGFYLRSLVSDSILWVWLGLAPAGIYSLDYFPLLPWFGVVLIGIFFGNTFYKNYKRQFRFPNLSDAPLIKSLCFMGRHSLLIYLIHQPILALILYLFVL